MRRALVALVCLLLLAPAGTARAAGRFGWPLAPPHPVLRPFSAPATPYGPGHRGVDLGGAVGEPVLAAADGVVRFAGTVVDRPLVSLDHGRGLRTTYEPVTPRVTTGQRVRRGDVLGLLRPGHPGCVVAGSADRACLHWGALRGGEHVDPLGLVAPGRVRLLPLTLTSRPAR
ncbi:M23 family metallopeptidase [Umezawaea beigongshangensis]|uniref:M23 family metallopeptidase n=1 Tax=Umezawaea beigongshangensis TaxID=2780383 RepID=UPI0018F248A2|nr:M23 family metallopeptidase [Umezawaea beigongshangensis]